jgi:hypothetical protein
MATKPGLYSNIAAKRRRIEQGSGERMREPGQKGAPTKEAFIASAKTAKQPKEESMKAVKKKASGGSLDMVMKGGKMVPSFAADNVGKMKKGGAVGMHKMPDGTMMKNSDMASMGRAVKRKTADVKGRAMKKGY